MHTPKRGLSRVSFGDVGNPLRQARCAAQIRLDVVGAHPTQLQGSM